MQNRPLREDELHEDLEVRIEIYGCKPLFRKKFEDCRPFGRVLCYTFSDEIVYSVNSYGYAWRAWADRPSHEDREKNKWK